MSAFGTALNAGAGVAYDLHYRVLVAGEERAGKTAFLERLNVDKFGGEYAQTIGLDVSARLVQSGEFAVNLQVFDAAGSVKFRKLLAPYAKQAHGIVLVFDATSRASFAALESVWLPFVAAAAVPLQARRVATLLIATHADSTQRVVGDDEARAFAAAHGFTYGEFDARTCTQHDALVLVESLVARLVADDSDRARLVRAEADEKARRDTRPALLKALEAALVSWRSKWLCGV